MISYRGATKADALDAAALVFASGAREFGFFLGCSKEESIAFLALCFASPGGRFSWRRHYVAASSDGRVVSVLAAHASQTTLADNLHLAWMTLRSFGLRRTAGILRRGIVLEMELSPPKRETVLLAHCATRDEMQGAGAFSMLFAEATASRFLPVENLVLDVLVSNARAAALYRRLGFVALPRQRPRARQLPAELESMRMRLTVPRD
jgi:ribosomal protein S18 acetylase RimI-like enzyme